MTIEKQTRKRAVRRPKFIAEVVGNTIRDTLVATPQFGVLISEEKGMLRITAHHVTGLAIMFNENMERTCIGGQEVEFVEFAVKRGSCPAH